MTTTNEELRKLAEAVSGEYDQMKHTTAENIAMAHKFQAFSRAAANPEAIVAILDQLQSQAERIEHLENDVNRLHQEAISRCRNQAELKAERDTLRAQLAEIGKAEPVAHQFQTADGSWHPLLTDKHYQDTKADGRWPIRELFTHPMPAESSEHCLWARNGHTPCTHVIPKPALSKYKGAKP